MTMSILTALLALDVTNDNHWTADGLPRIETVRFTAGDQKITREQIESAAPGFARATAVGYMLSQGSNPVPPEAPVAEVVTETVPPAANPAEAPAVPATPPAQGDSVAAEGVTASPLSEGVAAAPGTPEEVVQEVLPASDGLATSDDEDGEAEQPEMGAGEFDDLDEEDEIKALEAELEKAREASASIRREVDLLNEQLSTVVGYEDKLLTRIAELQKSNHTNTTAGAIQMYLARQREVLELRGQRRQMIADSGLDLKQLATDLKAPIDAAFAPRRGRGGQRPQGR